MDRDISNREVRGLTVKNMIAIIFATATVVGGGWKLYDNNEKDKTASNVRITTLEQTVTAQQGQINELEKDKNDAADDRIKLRDALEEIQRRFKRR